MPKKSDNPLIALSIFRARLVTRHNTLVSDFGTLFAMSSDLYVKHGDIAPLNLALELLRDCYGREKAEEAIDLVVSSHPTLVYDKETRLFKRIK